MGPHGKVLEAEYQETTRHRRGSKETRVKGRYVLVHSRGLLILTQGTYGEEAVQITCRFFQYILEVSNKPSCRKVKYGPRELTPPAPLMSDLFLCIRIQISPPRTLSPVFNPTEDLEEASLD